MSEDHESPDIADALVQALEAEGEEVDAGEFTLDLEMTRAKLREFALEEPAAYVLLLVEAAWIAGDRGRRAAIYFETGATTTVEFRCPNFDAHELADALATVFRRREDPERADRTRVLVLLGLALNAALAFEPKAVILDHVDDHDRHSLIRFTPTGAPVIEAGPGRPRGRTRFVVRGGVFDLRRPTRERALLRQRCRHASFPIWDHSDSIHRGLQSAVEDERVKPYSILPIDFEDRPSWTGKATMRKGSKPATLTILTRGVLSETITLERNNPGFFAIVDVDLRKDLSQRKVVRDAEFERVLATVADVQEWPQFRAGLVPSSKRDPAWTLHLVVWPLTLVSWALLIALVLFMLGLWP